MFISAVGIVNANTHRKKKQQNPKIDQSHISHQEILPHAKKKRFTIKVYMILKWRQVERSVQYIFFSAREFRYDIFFIYSWIDSVEIIHQHWKKFNNFHPNGWTRLHQIWFFFFFHLFRLHMKFILWIVYWKLMHMTGTRCDCIRWMKSTRKTYTQKQANNMTKTIFFSIIFHSY